jgi:hypothetical protein
MSTYIKFTDGTEVHISDVYTCGKMMHKYIEIGHTYDKEKIAVKRAINLNRKKRYNSIKIRRHRKKITHCRRDVCTCRTIMPTIVGYYEDSKKRYIVVETGKKFKRINNAIKNALNYVKQHSK